MAESPKPDPMAEARKQLLAWLTLVFRDPQEIPVEELARAEIAFWGSAAGIPIVGLPEPALEPDRDPTEELATEYVRLFVNSRTGEVAHLEAAAYLQDRGPEEQSAWLTELGAALLEAGYAADEGGSRSADHLSRLLEFLYREETASPPARSRFARRFLLPWLPTMLERLAAASPHPFYERAGRTLAACFECPFPGELGEP